MGTGSDKVGAHIRSRYKMKKPKPKLYCSCFNLKRWCRLRSSAGQCETCRLKSKTAESRDPTNFFFAYRFLFLILRSCASELLRVDNLVVDCARFVVLWGKRCMPSFFNPSANLNLVKLRLREKKDIHRFDSTYVQDIHI